jgi:tetratricopeptide (TPR) repeat protein
LFLPIASGLQTLIEAYQIRNRRLASIIKVFSFFIVACLVFATHIRNFAWQNEETLWQDAMTKAPSYARPYQNVAMYYSRTNRLDDAIELYKAALNLKDPNPDFSRFICLGNIGNIYKKKFQFEKAAEYLRAAVTFRGGKGGVKVRYNLVLCLLNSNGLDEALKHMNLLLAEYKNNSRFLATRGFIFIKLGDYQAALRDLQLALKNNPENINGLLNLAMALSSVGKFQQAEHHLQKAIKHDPQNVAIYLAMLENAVKQGDRKRTNQYLDYIINSFDREVVRSFFSALSKGYIYIKNTMVPVDIRNVSPLLSSYQN